MKFRTTASYAFASLLLALAPLQHARAEVSEVRLAQPTSMGYTQFSIMDRYKVGSTRKKPASWTDLFFPDIHNVSGS